MLRPVPIQLRPVRMKSTLYLLVPKGISELLDLDNDRECTLTTGTEDGNPVLKYTFSAKGKPVRALEEKTSERRTVSKQAKVAPSRAG